MQIQETYLEGCFIITPKVFTDERGYFFESFNKKEFQSEIGIQVNFIQDNQSFSRRGTLRGLHFQREEYAQAKLVRVVKGKVLDISVDIRPTSKTFGKHFSIILDDKNNKQVFIPRGFAHGFVVLSDDAIFSYKCDNYYNKEAESGIIYNDATLSVDWSLPEDQLIISEKDLELQTFETLFK